MAGYRLAARSVVLAAVLVVAAALVATPVVAAGSAADTLATAVANLNGQGYNLSGTSGSTAAGGSGKLTASGSVDPTSRAATLDLQGTEGGTPIDVDFTQIGDKFWAKLDVGSFQSQVGAGPDKWLEIDKSKLTSATAAPFDTSGSTDALDIAGLLTKVSDVTYPDPSDPTRVAGTVDLTAATGVTAPPASDLKDAGVAARRTPFTATVDGQGRLTDLTINADSYDGNLTNDFMFTDFGAPDAVTAPPAASVIPAPPATYAFFND